MSARTAIQTRLLLTVFIALPLIWLLAAVAAGFSLYDEVNELNDTQMSQLARRLLTVPYRQHDDGQQLQPLQRLLQEDDARGEADDHNMTFAVWDKHGRLLLADRGSRFLNFVPQQNGFHNFDLPQERGMRGRDTAAAENTRLQRIQTRCAEEEDDAEDIAECVDKHMQRQAQRGAERKHGGQWRVLYLRAPDGKISVAVGQNMKVRYEMVWETIAAQAVPWAAALPVLLLLMMFAVRRSLKPLNRLAEELSTRAVNDDTPLDTAVPREMQPLVDALNRLFQRIHETIEREHRFTADAAHELRSPLAALKVQAEVLSLSEDEAEKDHTLLKIRSGIDRAGRLIEQLLIMARLDPMTRAEGSVISWQEISDKVMQDANRAAREKHIRLKRHVLSGSLQEVLPLHGDALLIELMLRNLIDNAVRYTPEGGEVVLEMDADTIRVLDNGAGIAPEMLPRIRERFFRPPGQDASGSGLGLSIVERIAQLHGLTFRLDNRAEGGLMAEIARQ
ncbi:MAG: ATP-binding protein [Neisseria sp.]|nr:ATP-binding protein [Neisseria sp.]